MHACTDGRTDGRMSDWDNGITYISLRVDHHHYRLLLPGLCPIRDLAFKRILRRPQRRLQRQRQGLREPGCQIATSNPRITMN